MEIPDWVIGVSPVVLYCNVPLQTQDSQQRDTSASSATTSPCTYAVEPPCTGRYARWCERSALYLREPPTQLNAAKTVRGLLLRFQMRADGFSGREHELLHHLRHPELKTCGRRLAGRCCCAGVVEYPEAGCALECCPPDNQSEFWRQCAPYHKRTEKRLSGEGLGIDS